jgi:hypothetical protein
MIDGKAIGEMQRIELLVLGRKQQLQRRRYYD